MYVLAKTYLLCLGHDRNLGIMAQQYYGTRIHAQHRPFAIHAFAIQALLFVCVVLLCALAPLHGQNIRFKRITLQQGLSQSSVQAILHDNRGFLWFGTQDGLNCYDGYTINVYRNTSGDSLSLPNSFVQTLYEDRTGTLWIGTLGGGIAQMNRFTRHFTTFGQFGSKEKTSALTTEERNIYAIIEDKQGNIWVGTGGGLLRLNPSSRFFEERFTTQNSPLPSPHVRALHADNDGNIWVGTAKGLMCYNPKSKQWQYFVNNSGFADTDISAFAPDYSEDYATRYAHNTSPRLAAGAAFSNTLWIGTANGVYHFDCAQKLVTDVYPAPVKNAPVKTLAIGIGGLLWVGYEGEGLQMINTHTRSVSVLRHVRNQPESLSHNAVLSVLMDKHLNLWVGTDGAGVCYFNPDEYRFELISNDNGSGTNIVMSMLEDKQSRIWFGTIAGGLHSYDRRTGAFVNYKHEPKNTRSLSNNFVWSLAEDRSGAIWVGTNGGGLCRFDRTPSSAFTTYLHDDRNPSSLPHNSVYSMLEDSEGIFWVATDNGLAMMNRENGTFTTFRSKAETDNQSSKSAGQSLSGTISSNAVRVIYEDRRHTLWVGTRGGGLNRFNRLGKTFETFRHSPENRNTISNDDVMSIHEDTKGILWIGTANGLNRFDPASGSFTAFYEKDGLPNRYVCSIMEDSGGYLWLATGKGISRFNTQNGTFNLFEEISRRAGSEFNQDACLKDHEGYMYFGGVAGFIRFHPDSVQTNYLVPPVVFTEFKRFNKPVRLDTIISEKRELHLSVDDSFIAFEFAALSFSLPDKIKYSCKLENFDKDWNDLGTKREATYTNLAAGEYVLRVRATNYDGVQNNDGVSLRIIVHPHWWQTVWARLLAVAVVIASAFALYRWRVRRIEKRQQDLERTITERTAEISTGHDEILRQNDVLMQLNIEKNEFLGIAAHDLKNPLTSIILSASIIQQYQTRMTVPEINDQMDHILITAKRMQETILNLLDINAIESGRFTFSPIAMNVVEVVNDVVEGYYLRAKDKEISLHFNHDSDEIMTMCDRNALMQVLENLISNAIKYSPPGKNVYVNVLSSHSDQDSELFRRERDALVRLPMAEKHVRIEFQDEGPGLSEEDKTQLFQKFAKLSAKPTGGEHSTGLGLSIVKKIIEAMHGQVWCESELEHGATFIVELPISEVPKELLLERLS